MIQPNYYVTFVGWARSGHSLVGALLNFHPNIYIKNEFNPMLKRFREQEQIFNAIMRKKPLNKLEKKREYIWGGFKHEPFPGMNSGEPLIIGNKKGGITSSMILERYKRVEKVFDDIIKVPVKWIHVQRNPYDNISRIHIKKRVKDNLEKTIKSYFDSAESVNKILSNKDRESITIRLEDVVKNTEKELRKLCEFLEVPINEDHIRHCEKIVWSSPRKSREETDLWTKERIERVKEEMKKYPFMAGYSFVGE